EVDVGFGEKRSIANRMKAMITQKTNRINPKHLKPYRLPDRANFYFNSNYPDAMRVENSDRRYFIHEVQGQPKERKFYADFFQWIANGGAAAVFAHLLELDLTGFHPDGHAPMTNSKAEMIAINRGNADTWAMKLKDNPDATLTINNRPIPLVYWREEEVWEV